jgi:hypothetical protein
MLIEFRLGGLDNLVLQYLYPAVDLVSLKVYEHREGGLPLQQDWDERHHAIRRGYLQF